MQPGEDDATRDPVQWHARVDRIAVRAGGVAVLAAIGGATAMSLADGSQPVMVWLAILVPHVVLVLAGVAAVAARDRNGWAWAVRFVVLWPVMLLVGFLGYSAVLAFGGTGWSVTAGTLFLVAVAIPAALVVFGLVWPIAVALDHPAGITEPRPARPDPDFRPLT